MLTRHSIRLPGRDSRNELAVAAMLAVGLVAVLTVAAGWIGAGLAFVVPVLLLASLLLVVNARIEWSLVALLVYLGLLDGYVKLSTGNDLATLGRDFLLYSLAVGALMRLALSRERVTVPKYTPHVVLLVAVVLVQMLNPSTPGTAAAFGGLRQHVEFIPLFFLGYAVMRSERRLRIFVLMLLAIVAANTVVAVIQYNMSPDQLAAWGPGYAERINGRGDFAGASRNFSDSSGEARLRPFALGSDIGTSGILGSLGIGAAIALVALRGGGRLRIYGAAGVLFCVIGIVAAQSRGVVLTGIFALGCFAALSVRSRQAARGLIALLVCGGLMYGAVITFVSSNDSAAFSRLETLRPDRVQQTIVQDRGQSLLLVPEYAVRYPLGVGLGRAGPATGFGGDRSPLNAENEPNFLIGELGTFGFLVFASLWLRVVFDAIRVARRTENQNVRLYLSALATALLTTTLVWFQAAPTTGTPGAPMFWFVAGIVAWAVSRGGDAFVAEAQPKAA